MKIITPEERLSSEKGVKGVIFGEYGVGKTSLILTLPPENTLVIDIEAGLLAVKGHPVSALPISTWQEARDLAVLVCGPDLSRSPNQTYSQSHYEYVKSQNPDLNFDKYETIFIDSITELSRLSLCWAKQQPDSISQKTGKPDGFAIYGLHGQEMIQYFKRFQHGAKQNVWFVGILNSDKDEFNRSFWSPQMEGSKPSNELPGIFDQVMTLATLRSEDKQSTFRAFVCQKDNIYGFPAKDRSGTLNILEPPHLGQVMEKIKSGQRITQYEYSLN